MAIHYEKEVSQQTNEKQVYNKIPDVPALLKEMGKDHQAVPVEQCHAQQYIESCHEQCNRHGQKIGCHDHLQTQHQEPEAGLENI